MFGRSNLISLSALIATLAITSTAHTWVEEYQVIGPNSSYIGDRGYSRAFVARDDPLYISTGALAMQYLLPELSARLPDGGVRNRINSSDLVCHPSQRQPNSYNDTRYPKLKAAPGSYVAMKYLENGHVTLPWGQKGKPAHGGGTVYVFGTTDPRPDEKMVDVMKWTSDGRGGDGRGKLLTTQDYDDGRCHQLNQCSLSVERQAAFQNKVPGQDASAELWCETDVKIPDDIGAGLFTTYWVWQWPTAPDADCNVPGGKDEYYTTCADFDIADTGRDAVAKIAEAPLVHSVANQDAQATAVSTYMARTVLTTWPVTLQDWSDYMTTTATPSYRVNAAFASSCTAAALPPGVVPPPPPACPSDKWATGTLSAFYSSKGIESARLAAQAQRTKAPVSPSYADGTQPPASTPAAGDMPLPSVITVSSTLTTYYTSTVTMLPSTAPGNSGVGGPPPQLHTLFTIHGNGRARVSKEAIAFDSALSTVTTKAYTGDDCDHEPSPTPADVYVPTSVSAIASEHVYRHRAHARRFGV